MHWSNKNKIRFRELGPVNKEKYSTSEVISLQTPIIKKFIVSITDPKETAEFINDTCRELREEGLPTRLRRLFLFTCMESTNVKRERVIEHLNPSVIPASEIKSYYQNVVRNISVKDFDAVKKQFGEKQSFDLLWKMVEVPEVKNKTKLIGFLFDKVIEHWGECPASNKEVTDVFWKNLSSHICSIRRLVNPVIFAGYVMDG